MQVVFGKKNIWSDLMIKSSVSWFMFPALIRTLACVVNKKVLFVLFLAHMS